MRRAKEALVLILAGGVGSRLNILVQKRAKPAVPFAGKYRIIDFTLSNCVNSGIFDVMILAQYRPHSLIEQWLQTNYTYTKENRYEVAVLPFGATEPHNLHLPYGADILESTIIGERVCEAAHRQGRNDQAGENEVYTNQLH